MENEAMIKPYPIWRFQYWRAHGNMTYSEIDRAVADGTLTPGDMPPTLEFKDGLLQRLEQLAYAYDNAVAGLNNEARTLARVFEVRAETYRHCAQIIREMTNGE